MSLGIGLINSLPNDNILDLSRLITLADNQTNKNQMIKFVCDKDENLVGKGENASYQQFLPFLQCFQKPSSTGLLKLGTFW